jgi:hypothetical protein
MSAEEKTNVPAKLRQQDVLLRAMVDGVGIINDLHAITSVLMRGREVIRVPAEGCPGGQEVEVPLDRARVAGLNAAAGIKLKLLNKLLPDQVNATIKGDPTAPLHLHLSSGEEKL